MSTIAAAEPERQMAPHEPMALWLCGCDAPIDAEQLREYRVRGRLREVHTVCPRHGLTTLARVYPTTSRLP